MTADVTREPTGGQGLREALVRGLARAHGASYVEWADAVLALPEMAALIADAERVRRVRELLAEAIEDSAPAYPPMWVDDVRRALDGDQ